MVSPAPCGMFAVTLFSRCFHDATVVDCGGAEIATDGIVHISNLLKNY